MVENVVDLPAKLQRMFLAELDVLKEGQVVVEDARHAHSVPWHVTNLASRKRFGEATHIERSRCSSWIATEIALHRIADNKWPRVNPTTSEVSNRRAHLRCCR